MEKITPMLWFDGQAEEAANFYISVFKEGEIHAITHAPEGGPMPTDRALTVDFELRGQRFIALNGGPRFKFNEAISFVINCENQDEVDYFWDKLTADGGEESQCGWLTDKYGLSWQVVPVAVWKMMSDPDPARAHRAMNALWQMTKLDLATLQRAYDGD